MLAPGRAWVGERGANLDASVQEAPQPVVEDAGLAAQQDAHEGGAEHTVACTGRRISVTSRFQSLLQPVSDKLWIWCWGTNTWQARSMPAASALHIKSMPAAGVQHVE